MKKIINGQNPYILHKNIMLVTVPLLSELKPSNVIAGMELKTKKIDLYNELKKYCPEL